MEKEKKVVNGYGVLLALYVAKKSGKKTSEVIDMFNGTLKKD